LPGRRNTTASLFAFAAGAVLLHQSAELPGLPWLLALMLGASALPWRRTRLPAAFCLGILWALWQAGAALGHRLPAALEGKDLTVRGEIVSVEVGGPHYTRLLLQPAHVDEAPGWRPRLVRLGWYGSAPDLTPGEQWRLRVRLKRPNGLMNPGGFDYERWLFAQGIDAVGYVREPDLARRLADGWNLNRVRQVVADAVAARLDGDPAQGVIVALAVGERRWISDAQWDVLRTTGTAHLVAISGLHVGLVALLVGVVVARAWRLSAAACRRWPARIPGVMAGMIAAAAYAGLAGFTLPTQRALVMLLVPAVALLARRRVRAWHGFAVALVAVLLWDPFAPLSAGFWLSFGAVAVLLGAALDRAPVGWLRRTVGTQLAVGIGLLPVSVLWLQTAAWAAPVANIWAIPLIGLVVVPLTLAGTALLAVVPGAGILLDAAAWLAGLALAALERIAAHLPAGNVAAVPDWAIVLAAAAVILLLLPRGVPGRWLGVPLLLPLALAAPVAGRPGEALRLTLLDVGQGLSAVVEAGGEALVYDTGVGGDGFDAGAFALVPYLQSRGYRSVRWLIVSHDDADHSGGTGALARSVRIGEVRVGEPVAALGERARCIGGERIDWQAVELAFLWPPDGASSGNDASCVLRLEVAGVRILLTGDIGSGSELTLARERPQALQADVLVVPHHGSAYSSAAAFVDAVSPRYALVSAGYRNRYGFPRPVVIERYRAAGAEFLTTADEGAIEVRVMRDGSLVVGGYRRRQGRYFHRRPEL
jgi:competence protein ComEC